MQIGGCRAELIAVSINVPVHSHVLFWIPASWHHFQWSPFRQIIYDFKINTML